MEPQKLAWAKLSAPSTRPHWQGMTSTGTSWRWSRRYRADSDTRGAASARGSDAG